jgi:hypothetical protein
VETTESASAPVVFPVLAMPVDDLADTTMASSFKLTRLSPD